MALGTMLPSRLFDTYHRYKQDTSDIATWLATTAKQFGFSTGRLFGDAPSIAQKSRRLKGKGRKKAKESAQGSATGASTPRKLLPTHSIAIKEFVVLAEFLAPIANVVIPTSIWRAFDRAIRLRKMHGDYHVLQHADGTENSSIETHFYFLETLEKARDILSPRRSASMVQPENGSDSLKDRDKDVEGQLDNMFAILTVEEPSEEFLNAPDITPTERKVEPVEAVYEVEPVDDPLELYLGTAALLQDISKVRSTLRGIWQAHRDGRTSLVSASVATDIAVRQIHELEEQLLKDFPSVQDTLKARNSFFSTQCRLRGKDPSTRLRPTDPIYLGIYELVETALLGPHIVVEYFRNNVGETLELEHAPGYYGKYDPLGDRDNMSGPTKFDEDKDLLMKVLLEIELLQNVSKIKFQTAVDEFSKAFNLFREKHRHTLTLDFAAQVHLDIRHTLRSKVWYPSRRLRDYTSTMMDTLQMTFDCKGDLSKKTWSMPDQRIMRQFLDIVQSIHVFQDHTEPTGDSAYFKYHPWLCGSLLFSLQLDWQVCGIRYANIWKSVTSVAHLYNAAREEKLMSKAWPDMELALKLYGESTIFVGTRPREVNAYWKRFCISDGLSARNFAPSSSIARTPGKLIATSQGPRGMLKPEVINPVAHELRFGYGYSKLHVGLAEKKASKIEDVLEKCLEKGKNLDTLDADSTLSRNLGKIPKNRRVFSLPDALIIISKSLASEEVALSFDHVSLDRTCWDILRSIKEEAEDNLVCAYGNYMKTEDALLVLPVFIFMDACNASIMAKMKLPKGADAPGWALQQAGTTIQEMLEEGRGAQEISKLKTLYGLKVAV